MFVGIAGDGPDKAQFETKGYNEFCIAQRKEAVPVGQGSPDFGFGYPRSNEDPTPLVRETVERETLFLIVSVGELGCGL